MYKIYEFNAKCPCLCLRNVNLAPKMTSSRENRWTYPKVGGYNYNYVGLKLTLFG